MSDNPFEEFRPKAANPFAEFASTPEAPSIAEDVAKSGAIGVAKGGIGLAGTPGDLSNMLARSSQIASDYIAKRLGIDAGPRAAETILPTAASLQKNVEGVTGEFYKPKTTAGEYAQTAGEFLPAAMGGPESVMSRLASRVAIPSIASETAGQITKGTDVEPYARVAAGLVSPLATAGIRRAVTPLPISPERAALVDTLHNEGVDLTAGQRTGSRPLQWAESTLGDMPGAGGVAARTQENQAEQFTAAALRRIGETGNRAYPATVNNAFDRIGNQFETIGARNHLAPDQQLVQDLQGVHDRYNRMVGPNARVPAVADTIGDIADQIGANGGHMGGDQYVAMRSQLGADARAARNDPYLREALHGHQDALDNAFERTLQASGNIGDINALRQARREYRNLMVVERAATGAGSQTAEGLISPSQLRNATVTQDRRGYARGQGDFADLARSGEAIMKPLPNSGTAPRQYMQHIISLLGAGVGGATGGFPGAAAGIAAPAAAGRVLMSRPVQAYLGNQVLAPAQGSRAIDAVTAALLAHQGNETRGRLDVYPSVARALQDQQP